jgi:hypothetical protein
MFKSGGSELGSSSDYFDVKYKLFFELIIVNRSVLSRGSRYGIYGT